MKAKESELKIKLKAQKKFGELVVKMRKKQAVPPAELARRCFFERSSIARIERGDNNVTIFTMVKIASALGVKLEELLEGFDGKK